ncbi:major facilitator superfamily domain-containing protein [Xylariales sp. PMI_506]|nr:major facilitator superfamily domain-containing protein [Xylariales sp. PMI_506]
MEREQPNETTGLLDSTEQAPSSSKRPGHWRVILTIITIHLLLNIGRCLAIAPDTSILMDIVCNQYYAEAQLGSGTPPTDDRCKIEPVQSEVALINSWRSIVEFLPGVLLAVPYGALADRIGRKTVFMLTISGCLMSDVWPRLVYWFTNIFPIRTSCLGGLFYVVGGGGNMIGALQFVIISDVCPAQLRATAFAWTQSALLLAQFVFTPVGGSLISVNPWIPMFMSSGAMVLALLVTMFFLPETLPLEARKRAESPSLLLAEGNHGANYRDQLRDKLANLAKSSLWLARNMKISLILLCVFFFTIGQQENSSLLLQYAYKRFDWSLGEASYLFSISACTTFVVLILLIPAASSFLRQRLNLHEAAKDKLIAQISGSCLTLGSGLIFLAASGTYLVIGQLLVSLGLAFSVMAKSVVTSMVDQLHLATVFTALSVMTSLGSLIGAALLAYAFKEGMKLGGIWIGSPFLIATICFALALSAISFAPTHAREGGAEENGPLLDDDESSDIEEPNITSV